jgi:hypothetical protein
MLDLVVSALIQLAFYVVLIVSVLLFPCWLAYEFGKANKKESQHG